MEEMVKTVQRYKTIIQSSLDYLEKSRIVISYFWKFLFISFLFLIYSFFENETRQVSYQNTQISFENEESNVRFGGADSFAQKQLQQNNQLQLVEERADQMRQLERDIVDLNSMFKDISVLVHDQGDLIGKKKVNYDSRNLNFCWLFFLQIHQ